MVRSRKVLNNHYVARLILFRVAIVAKNGVRQYSTPLKVRHIFISIFFTTMLRQNKPLQTLLSLSVFMLLGSAAHPHPANAVSVSSGSGNPEQTTDAEARAGNPTDNVVADAADTATTPAEVLEYLSDNAVQIRICRFSSETSRSVAYPVETGQYIIEALCSMGAYQGAYEYWSYQLTESGPNIQPLILAQFSTDNSGQIFQYGTYGFGGLTSFDVDQQTLTIFAKARGIGDCGWFAQYQWNGSTFDVIEFRAKNECDGNYIEPENYPQLYPLPAITRTSFQDE